MIEILLHKSVCLCTIAATLLTIGCESKSSPVVVAKGTVMVGNKPLSGAFIMLEPVRGTTGTNASASVFNGEFTFGPEAKLSGGTYLVRVSMIPTEIRRKVPTQQIEWMPDDDAVVHPKFDRESQVTCDLVPGQDNTLEFEIKFAR